MQIKEFLEHICEQIKYQPIRAEIAQELENHLKESKEQLISEGLTEENAEQKAISQMGNAEEIGKKLNKIHSPKLDWKLLLLTLILIIFGSLVTFTRTHNCINYANEKGVLPYYSSMSQYTFTLAVGAVLSICVYFFDYRKILKMPKTLYGVATFLILFAMLFGYQVNGSKIYLYILGNTFFMPSIAVPLYILAFIGFLQKINSNKNLEISFLQKKFKMNLDILKIIILGGISLLILQMAPATVLMLILGAIYLVLASVKLWKIKKSRKRNLAILWGIPVALGILFLVTMMPMASDRLIGSFAPEQDPKGRGWIGVNQKMILDSANLFGEAGDMSNAISLFDEGTNFAFISILAHYGWVVSVVMVIAIVFFSIKLMVNVTKIKDMAGKLTIMGISGLFILQSIFNLLMNLNLGLKTNVNIPFISYGRQDLILNMMCLALVLSVYRRKDILGKRRKPKQISCFRAIIKKEVAVKNSIYCERKLEFLLPIIFSFFVAYYY